jgi:hypothetical protein
MFKPIVAGTSIKNKASFFHFQEGVGNTTGTTPQSALNLFLAEKKSLKDKYPHNKVRRIADNILLSTLGGGVQQPTDLAKLKMKIKE